MITPLHVSIVVAAAAVITGAVKAWPWLAAAVRIVEVIVGTPARPGVPAVPGIGERMGAFEKALADVKAAAESAAYHSAPNGGGSAYDQRTRQIEAVREQVGSIRDDMQHVSDQVARHVEESKTWVRAVDDALAEHGIDTPDWPSR